MQTFLSDPVTAITIWLQTLLFSWGIPAVWVQLIMIIIGSLIVCAGAMFFVLFLIWYERKVIGRVQDRFGPNRLGPFGIFQTIADMLKIFTKEHITPLGADKIPYNLAPVLIMGAVLMMWAVIPLSKTTVGADLDVGILYLVAIGGLGELGVIMAGWGSNNKYSMLAAFRALAVLISYEVPMVLTMLIPVMLSGSMSLNGIIAAQNVWYIAAAPLAAAIFFISQIAEVGRAPFDVTEAESELVAGYNTEYSGLKFGMFYVADFLHAFTAALVFAVLFLGGWRGPGAEQIPIVGFFYLFLKTMLVHFVGVLIRASVPRFRVDQMMALNWKFFTPVSVMLVILISLVDKAAALSQEIWRSLLIFAVNGVVFLVSFRLLDIFTTRKERPSVVTRQLPVAVGAPQRRNPESGVSS
ncbi:MAG: NADH-quinone oxidoreductase subunit NuoH [Anaerolineae bacterium]|nr:NADH-quinone oxidoreductase subunit NuoH [Anaerolineae bacterium]